MNVNPLTLYEFNSIVAEVVNTSRTARKWVTAEISSLQVRRGHCYLELVEKDGRGNTIAKARGVIWANTFALLSQKFFRQTGNQLADGMKVMAECSANFHPAYGLSLVISDIDGEYTLGDMARRRREAILRLTDEGIIDMNKALELPQLPQRVAVISTATAAGYGDFMHQVENNPQRVKVFCSLFEATVQGTTAPASIISALERIAANIDDFDLVVIIRGGGATDDLACFEDYELAMNVAQFPLPIVIGIGHERDITLLDFVAHTRVKTPTASAEMIIGMLVEALNRATTLGNSIALIATTIVADERVRLERLASMIGVMPTSIVRNGFRAISDLQQRISDASRQALRQAVRRIDRLDNLTHALAPEAVMRRGYSITRNSEGQIVRSGIIGFVKQGDTLVTQFADNTSILSTVSDLSTY